MVEPAISPDISLTQDESFVATSHRGLTYPLGERTPAVGEAIAVARGVHWVRIPMAGTLDHINCWLVADGAATTVVDTGLNVDPSVEAWRALFDAEPLASAAPQGVSWALVGGGTGVGVGLLGIVGGAIALTSANAVLDNVASAPADKEAALGIQTVGGVALGVGGAVAVAGVVGLILSFQSASETAQGL